MFPCFRVLGGPQGPVFCVFVFWAGTTGLCFVFSCFGRPPSKHSTGPKTYDVGNSFRWCELSTKSFLVHHTQLLAAAAQVGDAKGIRKEVTEKKMRLLKDALKATGRG